MRRISSILLAAALFAGCKDKRDETEQEKDSPSPAAKQTAPEDPSKGSLPSDSLGRLRALAVWLPPEATATATMRGGANLDPVTLATVFALPPKAIELLENSVTLEKALDASIGEEIRQKALGTELLAFRPPVATGNYLLRPLQIPVAEFEVALKEAGFDRSESEAIALFVSNRFPWKLALLPNNSVAFIPGQEVGSGLAPLTAGRDLDPSAMEDAVFTLLEGDPGIVATVHAGGPMLHLDVTESIEMTEFVLRRSQDGGMDGSVVLHPSRNAEDVARQLESRSFPEEDNQTQALVDDAAFSAQGKVVQGRLQLKPERVAALGR